MPYTRTGHMQYMKLEQRLVLLAWLNGLFGYENNRDLLADMKQAAEGFDASGRSHVCHRFETREDKVKIPPSDLARYDDNIRKHLRAMNARRPEPIKLRYFQHLAVLYTEIFLDAFFRRRGEMLRSLNTFVEKRNAVKSAGEPKDAKFSESDLKKLAFWMATGSGKTLIMHINYRQFLHYNDIPLDNILRKYAENFYRLRRERWDSKHMVYRTLDEGDPNLSFNQDPVREHESSRYVVKIQRSESDLVSAVEKLIGEVDRLYKEETGKLPRIYFDRHLYQPLLVEHGDKVTMTPPGLNESEAQFVRDMKDYWANERDKSLAKVEVFLLRNLSRGMGIGFFEERWFYPDFILWIMDGKKQHIVFVEPHGMRQGDAYMHDEKARLHESLPDLAKGISARGKRKAITLDSYIVSATPYKDLRRKYGDGTWDRKRFADAHILFQERGKEYDYMERIFTDQLTRRYRTGITLRSKENPP